MKRTDRTELLYPGHVKKKRPLEIKEQVRFEDYHKHLEDVAKDQEKSKTRKKDDQDKINFSSFVPLDPFKKQVRLFNHLSLEKDLCEEFCLTVDDPEKNNARKPPKRTLADIVSFVFDAKALDVLIAYNVKMRPDELPGVLYSENPGIAWHAFSWKSYY